jgi:hypothetical protein
VGSHWAVRGGVLGFWVLAGDGKMLVGYVLQVRGKLEARLVVPATLLFGGWLRACLPAWAPAQAALGAVDEARPTISPRILRFSRIAATLTRLVFASPPQQLRPKLDGPHCSGSLASR